MDDLSKRALTSKKYDHNKIIQLRIQGKKPMEICKELGYDTHRVQQIATICYRHSAIIANRRNRWLQSRQYLRSDIEQLSTLALQQIAQHILNTDPATYPPKVLSAIVQQLLRINEVLDIQQRKDADLGGNTVNIINWLQIIRGSDAGLDAQLSTQSVDQLIATLQQAATSSVPAQIPGVITASQKQEVIDIDDGDADIEGKLIDV
jgi:hypothetical protein